MILNRESLGAVGFVQRLAMGSSAWIAAERIASSALNIATIIAIARILGVVEYGHYAFAISLVAVGLAFGHLGLDGLLIKRVIRSPELTESLLGSVCLAKYAVYLPLFGLFLASGMIIDLGPGGAGVVRSLAPIFLIVPLSSVMICWLNAHSRYRKTSLARIVAVSLGTLGKLAVIFAGFGVQTVGLGHSFIFYTEAALLAWLVWSLGGPLPTSWIFDRAVLKDLLAEGAPLFLASLCAMVYMSADVIMLRLFTSPRVVGEYALVPQIVQAMQILPYAITLAAFPGLVASSENGDGRFLEDCAAIARRLLALGSVLALLLIFVGPALIPAVFGEDYRVTGTLLQVGAIGLPFLFLRQLTTKMFICVERGKAFALLEVGGLLCVVALNLVLIPRYGALGAAASSVVVYALTTLVAMFLLSLVKPLVRRYGAPHA